MVRFLACQLGTLAAAFGDRPKLAGAQLESITALLPADAFLQLLACAAVVLLLLVYLEMRSSAGGRRSTAEEQPLPISPASGTPYTNPPNHQEGSVVIGGHGHMPAPYRQCSFCPHIVARYSVLDDGRVKCANCAAEGK